MKLKIKKGDKVIVISGADKGKSGTVKLVDEKNMKLLIEGVNLKKRHTKPSRANAQGGIVSQERPLHYAKVMLMDSKGKPTRIGSKVDAKTGAKSRIAKTTGEALA